MRTLALPLALALVSLPACIIVPGGGQACTDLAAASVGVTIDTSDGGSLDGLELTYRVDGVNQGGCTNNTGLNDGQWICGYEQRGTIEVTATLPGYDTMVQSVEVGADECHVIQEFIDFTLRPSDTVCDQMALVSVQVNLTGSSGEALEDPAVDWSADGSEPAACDTADGVHWNCGWEVEGDFVISAIASGHAPELAAVTVPMTADGCHVITQTVDIALDWGAD